MTKQPREVKRVLTLPVSIIRLLEPFGAIFQVKTWQKAQLLLVGAILSPGKRTVTSALQVMGQSGVQLAVSVTASA